ESRGAWYHARLHPTCLSRNDRSLRRDLQIGEVPLRAGADPQGHASFLRLELHVVDDQARLFRAVHEEPGLRTFDLDPVSGPDARLHIDVRLVLLWSFLPRSGEVEIRIRAVLRGVIPPDLIVGT